MAETKQGEQQDQSRIKTLVILTTDSAGKGNDDLGRNIVTNFIKTMKEMGDDLWRLVLLNGGVKLAVEGAEVLPQLQALAHEGLDILVPGLLDTGVELARVGIHVVERLAREGLDPVSARQELVRPDLGRGP